MGGRHPVYGTALATIVLVVCAFGYMGAKGISPQNASRWLGGMFAAIFAAVISVFFVLAGLAAIDGLRDAVAAVAALPPADHTH